MQTPVNRFKAALRDGPVQLGFWLALAHPDIAEICAGLGYDWLLIDGEHGPQARGPADQVQAGRGLVALESDFQGRRKAGMPRAQPRCGHTRTGR